MRILSAVQENKNKRLISSHSFPNRHSHFEIGTKERAIGLVIPFLLIIAAVASQYTGLDKWLASLFYSPEIIEWSLRRHWIVEGILHDIAQDAIKLFGAAFLLFIVVQCALSKEKRFTSAHASSGYAFVALYYAALIFNPSQRFRAIGLGMVLGLTFGIAQQMRGAHFLSHDLFALAICWVASRSVYAIFYPKNMKRIFGYF